ncbi:MAG: SpoIIE family protein phosphatase [Gammaproteobacteria bacterium]|nr:SpoIIE family protein phosphatase [Gammaproteobacteria bacterium]
MSEAAPPKLREAPELAASFLADLTQEFASSLDIDETLKNAIDRFMVHLDAEAASIFLLEDDDTTLVCRECAGPVDIRGLRLAADQGIVGQTVARVEPRIVRDVAEDASFAAKVDADSGFATRSILCVPLAVRGRCLGALELLNKRGGDGLFERNDLELASVVAAAAALAIHNARMAAALVEQERVRKELELARHIQESLLPPREGAEFAVHGVNIPAREVSGDFYDFMPLADGRVYFALADVSGKGMNAALLMAKTTSLLRCLAKSATSAGALLHEVNNEICERSTLGMFVTVVAGFLEPRSGQVELANAGHHPALLRGADGSLRSYAAGAPPLGVLADIDFPGERIALDGGTLYLYTDGISESISADGAELGVLGLSALFSDAAPLSAALRLDAVVAAWRAAGYRSHDDITLMLVEVPKADATRSEALNWRFTADAMQLKPMRERVRELGLASGWSDKLTGDLVLAINEACMNIIEHAYGPDNAGEIVLEILNNENEVEIVLTDFAAPIELDAIHGRALEDVRPGGLGTHFMSTIMDSLSYTHLATRPGNVLRMRKRLEKAATDC